MPIVPSSALTKFIASLGDKETIKAATLPNRLAKHVKPEELEWSGVADRIRNLDPKQSVTKQDLLDWDANRNDVWSESPRTRSRGDTTFDSTTISSSDSSTYFEDVRQFNERAEEPDILGDIMDSFDPDLSQQPLTGSGPQSRQVQSHFSRTSPNYFAHARGTIEPIGGKKTRLVQEVQSDLHQNAIGAGGYAGDTRYALVDSTTNRTITDDLPSVAAADKAKDLTVGVDIANLKIVETAKRTGPPKSPLKKNWARKEIERQILKAVDEGQEAVAIPLEGARGEMARSEGVQRWYETQVRSTLKKIAKQIPGAEYKEIGGNAKPLPPRGSIERDQFFEEGLVNGYIDIDDLFQNLKTHGIIANTERQVEYGEVELAQLASTLPEDIQRSLAGTSRSMLTLPAMPERFEFYTRLLMESNEDFWPEVEKILKNNGVEEEIIDDVDSADYAADLIRDLPENAQQHVMDKYNQLYGAEKGITYGQIILPPSEKVPGKARWTKPPETEGEFGEFMQNVFNKDGDKIAEFGRKLAKLASEDKKIVNEEYIINNWDKVKQFAGVAEVDMVWPELTPEIRQVFKQWENPPTTLTELNKLQAELPNSLNEKIQNIASNSAMQARFGDLEEFRLAINKSTGIYKSSFEGPDLYGLIEDIHPRDIEAMPEQLGKDVEEAITIIDDPNIVINFMKKHWDTISKEQGLPKTKEKITLATYRYPEWTKKFELYSAGALGLAATATPDDARAQERAQREEDPVGSLLREGVDLEELSLAIQDKNGMTPEEARDAIHTSMQANIDQLIGQEEPELIEAAMQEKYGDFIADANFNYGGDFPEEPMAGESNYELVPVADIKEYANKSEQELYAANENFNFVHSELINLFKGVALEDEDAMLKFNKYNKDLNYHIANNLRSMGRNVEVGEDNQLWVVNEDGSKEPISDGFWSDMGMALAASEKEIGFGVGGAIAAGMAAKRVLPYLGLPGKLASAGVLLAEMTGGVAGTVVGRGLDMAYNSYTEKEDVELNFYTKQLMEAGMFDFVAGATIGASLKVAKETILGVGRALKYIASGTPNREGAYKALKHYTNLSDEDIEELVTKYEQTTGTTLPGSKEEKGMAAVPQMQPDAESLVDTASKYSPTLTTDIARTIDARAKDVINLAQETSPDNIGIVVKDALQNYEKDVKSFYTTVKTKAIKKVDPAYQFDFDRTAVKPFLKDIESRITNPSIQRRVQLYLDRVEQIGELRSFKDLLDLRSTMNDFKYNTRIRSAVDFDSINKVISKIDSEIETAVDTMPDGQAWLKEWKMANTEYSKMLKTRKNALYKVLNRPGVSEKVMVTAMSKYINSLDGTFMQVVSKLPVRKRKMVEGAVLEHLVGKHTIGDPQGMQAINFPGLSEELKSIGFTSTKARNLKRGVNMLSDVFKNDHNLARLSNTIHTEKAAQGLTTDLVAKAHYSLMAKVWSKMQSIIPFNNNAEFVALGLNIEKVLRNPQNAKAVEDLIKMFPKDEEIESGVRQLALISADFGKRENYPYVKLHKIGGDRKVRNGKYGKGVYYSTDEGSVKGKAGPNKLKTSSREVLPELIATPADIKAILGAEELTPEMIKASPDLKDKLMNRGYEGFAIGHDVVIFPE